MKVCVVKSCPSGRNIKKKTKDKPDSLSFFQPRTPARLKSWTKSLGMPLKASDYICQLHFKEEHIKLYDTIKIGGMVYFSYLHRKVLKEEAIPTIEHQFKQVPVQHQEIITIIPQKLNPYHSRSKEQNPNQSRSKEQNPYHTRSKEQQQRHVQNNNTVQQELLVEQQACDTTMDYEKQTQDDFEGQVQFKQRKKDSEEHHEIEMCIQSIDYLKSNIKKKTILPPYWFYIEKPKVLEFMRMDPKSMQIKHHICLNEDLSITAIYSNNEEFPLNKKITSFDNIYDFLKSVEKWPICVGTQMERKEYSSKCKGVIAGDETYKRNQMNPRCKACRSLRSQLQTRSSISRIVGKAMAQKRLTENLAKNSKCLKKMSTPSHLLKESMSKPSTIEIKNEFDVDAINGTTLPIDNLKNEHIDNESHEEPQTFINNLPIDNGSYTEEFIDNGSYIEDFIEDETDPKPDTFVDNLDEEKPRLKKQDELSKRKVKDEENGEVMKTKRKPKQEVVGEKFECVECGKVFNSRKTYRYHLKVHKGLNRYRCPRCDKVYHWKYNLERHMKSHMARDSVEQYCESCDKHFASVETFRQHLRISRQHVSESEFNFMCNVCDKRFVNGTRLRDHIDWEHLKKIKFKCQLCNKPFKSHNTLYAHLQNVHRNKRKRDNLCHVCGKSFLNSTKLKNHIVAIHNGETPYQCQHCNTTFGWYSNLYRHVQEVHLKIRQRVQYKSTKKSKKQSDQSISLSPPDMALDNSQ